jgi:hypothetical protein
VAHARQSKTEGHMKNRLWLCPVAGLWLSVALFQPLAVHAAGDDDKDLAKAIEVICLTEQPVIVEGKSASLRAWATTKDGAPVAQPISFEWQVTAGRIQGTGAEVRWDLAEVSIEPGELHKKVVATAKAVVPSLGEALCSAEVFIGKKEVSVPIRDPSDTRGGLIPARRFLLPNEREEAGYGLYSYLLFSTRPQNEEEKTRYLKAIESCLLVMQDIDEYLKRHRRPSELNATHLPVTRVPKSSQSPAEWAQNVLAVYDYATSQVLLNRLDKTYQRGPYLISVLKPLSEFSTATPVYLVQDLAGVVPDLASNWVRLFNYLTAQQRSWTDQSLRRFGFTMRNLIAVAGKITPEIAGSLKTMIQFIKVGE